MIKKDRLLSLLLVILMMSAAALTVNKTLTGHKFSGTQSAVAQEPSSAEAITVDSDGNTIVHTAGLPDVINGYAGPVDFDIYITDGRISKIDALPNAETPQFFERAAAIIPTRIGKTPAEALGDKVDGVTGATYSSNAIINNINAGLAYYEGTATKSGPSAPWKIWVALGVTLAACILPLWVKNKSYHTVQMIANVAVLGFWCGTFLDYSLILTYISDGFTWPAGLIAIAMLTAAFIYPLFGHPQHYCTHICPLGSAQQLMGQICGYKIKMSPKAIKGLDMFRRLLWAALMLLLWADCLTEWMDLELFRAFLFESASWWIIGFAIAFIALSAIVSRPYCRFVCPTGSLFKRSENIG